MQALSGAAWLVAGRLVGDVLAFALFVFIAREYGPVGTGVYAFHFAIATIAYELVSLGIEEYGVREYARRSREDRNAVLGSLFGAQVLLALTAATIVLAAGLAVGQVHVPLLAFMLSWQLAFAVARTLFIPAFVAGQIAVQVLAETAVRAAVLAVALAVAAGSGTPSLLASLVGLPLFAGALLGVALLSTRHFAGQVVPDTSLRGARTALRAIWPFAAANFVSGLYARTGILALFVFAGGVQAGLFASAYKFGEVSWALLVLVPAAAYPWLARAFRESAREFQKVSSGVFRVTLLCGGLFAWGTYWLAPPLIDVLLGPGFQPAAPLVRALAGFVALVAIAEALERVLLAAELQQPRLRIVVLQAALNLILNLVLVPLVGVAGTIVAFVFTQLVAIPLLLHALRAQIEARDAWRSMAIYTLAVAGALLCGQLPRSLDFWVAPLLSLSAFLLIAYAGGLLRAGLPTAAALTRATR